MHIIGEISIGSRGQNPNYKSTPFQADNYQKFKCALKLTPETREEYYENIQRENAPLAAGPAASPHGNRLRPPGL
jgi:hypothetical protein